jgi:hypothetical protein
MPNTDRERLSVWEALWNEHKFITKEESDEHVARLAQDFNRECQLSDRSDIPEKSPHAPKAEKEEKELASYLCSKLRSRSPKALCLSGGGIRSATIALGVLQALAHRSWVDAKTGDGSLLGEIASRRITADQPSAFLNVANSAHFPLAVRPTVCVISGQASPSATKALRGS